MKSRTIKRWTTQEESILREKGPHLTSHELTKVLPDRSACAISARRMRMGIVLTEELRSRIGAEMRSKVNLDNLRKADYSLTLEKLDNQTRQILLGTILGDASIRHRKPNYQRRGKNGRVVQNVCKDAHLYIGHGASQMEYLQWKVSHLDFIFKSNSKKAQSPRSRYEAQSVQHPLLSKLREGIYGAPAADGKRHKSLIPQRVASNLDMLGLLIWYLDDGSIHKSPRKDGSYYYGPLSIAVKGYKLTHLEQVVKTLNNNLGLNAYLRIDKFPYECKHLPEEGKINKIIMFTAAESRRIIKVWQQYADVLDLPSEMRYKLPEEISIRQQHQRDHARRFALERASTERLEDALDKPTGEVI